MIGMSLIKAGKSRVGTLARQVEKAVPVRRAFTIGKMHASRRWTKACERYPICQKLDDGWRYYNKPLNEMLETYGQNKSRGRMRAIGSVFREQGVGTPIGGAVGAMVGLPTPILGGFYLLGSLGCHVGRALEIGAKSAAKLTKKFAGKAVDTMK